MFIPEACVYLQISLALEVDQVFLLVDNVLRILGGLLIDICPLGRSDGLDILCMAHCPPFGWFFGDTGLLGGFEIE